MADVPNDGGDELIGDSIPQAPPKPTVEKPDFADPWYRPAKQYLRRQQWNVGILNLLNRLPAPEGEPTIIRYVGLPGQHYLDVLSMGRLCNKHNLRIDYLGFRKGDGGETKPERLNELPALSNQTHYTPESITYPDNIANIGRPDTLATTAFIERGPFDVVNLDVCGGMLHGDTTPLLSAIKYVLTSQIQRPLPWLLFVTTAAKAEDISPEVIAKFFAIIQANCKRDAGFQKLLAERSLKLQVVAEKCLEDPAKLPPDGFLRYFTLAFGKWLAANLWANNPRSTVTLKSVFSFRNTGRREPEMLSLAYLISPLIRGGADPSGLTGYGAAAPDPEQEYTTMAVTLVDSSLDGLKDLDQVWCLDRTLKVQIVAECEDLLRTLGADDAGIEAWRCRHGLAAGQPV